MGNSQLAAPRDHILTVVLDDYYHSRLLRGSISQGTWYRFDSRLEANTLKTLNLLRACRTKATFFVMGWVAEHFPELVASVSREGHEVANQGYDDREIRGMDIVEFTDDLLRAREAVQRAAGSVVMGHRSASPLTAPQELWFLNLLAAQGYRYDSSLLPLSGPSEQRRPFVYHNKLTSRAMWEIPLSTIALMGHRIAFANGTSLRLAPSLCRQLINSWHKAHESLVMSFHVWELDADQPLLAIPGRWTRICQYRHLRQFPSILEDILTRHRFGTVSSFLGLEQIRFASKTPVHDASAASQVTLSGAACGEPNAGKRTSVTVVIPLFNEERVVTYLFKTLDSVKKEMRETYDLHFVLVDDGSSDGTWKLLKGEAASRNDCRLVQHVHNQGIAAALLTGIKLATTDVVCSMDCDCTYDPHKLGELLSLLTDDVDMVTASPYHPDGRVLNVPQWRLALSKSASWLYRRLLGQQLYTFTSCFRAYRRGAVLNLQLKENGFLGIAEMAGKLHLSGSTIREYPATLNVRLLGTSKMKVLRTIAGHLVLMFRLSRQRWQSRSLKRTITGSGARTSAHWS